MGAQSYNLTLDPGTILRPIPSTTSKLTRLLVFRSAFRTLWTSSIFTILAPTCSERRFSPNPPKDVLGDSP